MYGLWGGAKVGRFDKQGGILDKILVALFWQKGNSVGLPRRKYAKPLCTCRLDKQVHVLEASPENMPNLSVQQVGPTPIIQTQILDNGGQIITAEFQLLGVTNSLVKLSFFYLSSYLFINLFLFLCPSPSFYHIWHWPTSCPTSMCPLF